MGLEQLIREKRDEKGIDNAHLAEILGVTQPTISRWLGGQPPGDSNAERVADFLEMPLDGVLTLIYEARQRQAASRRQRLQEPGVDTDDGETAELGADAHLTVTAEAELSTQIAEIADKLDKIDQLGEEILARLELAARELRPGEPTEPDDDPADRGSPATEP